MTEKHLLATTRMDRHNTILTLEAVQDLVRQLNGERKPAMFIQHDRTCPPMGAAASGEIRQAPDGHHEAFVEYDVFPAPRPVNLPGGAILYEQFSRRRRCPSSAATIDLPDKELSVTVDAVNFESPEDVEQFYSDLRGNCGDNFEEKQVLRKSLIPDPEIIFTLGMQAAGVWLAARAVAGVGNAVSDIAKDETKKLYGVIREAVLRFATRARPNDRPRTYILRVPGPPHIELVAVSRDPEHVVGALTDGLTRNELIHVETTAKGRDPELIQFLMASDGTWRFNYLVGKDGCIVGSADAFMRQETLLFQVWRPKLSKVIDEARRRGVSVNIGPLPNGSAGCADAQHGVTLDSDHVRGAVPEFPEDRMIVVLFHELGHLKYFAALQGATVDPVESEYQALTTSLVECLRIAREGDSGPLRVAIEYMQKRQSSGKEPKAFQKALDRVVTGDVWGEGTKIVNTLP